ncbi:Cytoskeleton-associated protein 5 [Carpediemonas membranifera]|uniref:Cytoskeleton-associated protein 5 n=1 Tax=Carpediemonas membranifera TaxID=201153 RepID=A0A8J6AS92_9EUKA|nr:Cytoskeleton-associated protein 5 [Carpediemonas membranifera]|eukprot:KAG9391025.1 Cytoskeleton-associated protein 5 [Carpediemonas membranifera]
MNKRDNGRTEAGRDLSQCLVAMGTGNWEAKRDALQKACELLDGGVQVVPTAMPGLVSARLGDSNVHCKKAALELSQKMASLPQSNKYISTVLPSVIQCLANMKVDIRTSATAAIEAWGSSVSSQTINVVSASLQDTKAKYNECLLKWVVDSPCLDKASPDAAKSLVRPALELMSAGSHSTRATAKAALKRVAEIVGAKVVDSAARKLRPALLLPIKDDIAAILSDLKEAPPPKAKPAKEEHEALPIDDKPAPALPPPRPRQASVRQPPQPTRAVDDLISDLFEEPQEEVVITATKQLIDAAREGRLEPAHGARVLEGYVAVCRRFLLADEPFPARLVRYSVLLQATVLDNCDINFDLLSYDVINDLLIELFVGMTDHDLKQITPRHLATPGRPGAHADGEDGRDILRRYRDAIMLVLRQLGLIESINVLFSLRLSVSRSIDAPRPVTADLKARSLATLSDPAALKALGRVIDKTIGIQFKQADEYLRLAVSLLADFFDSAHDQLIPNAAGLTGVSDCVVTIIARPDVLDHARAVAADLPPSHPFTVLVNNFGPTEKTPNRNEQIMAAIAQFGADAEVADALTAEILAVIGDINHPLDILYDIVVEQELLMSIESFLEACGLTPFLKGRVSRKLLARNEKEVTREAEREKARQAAADPAPAPSGPGIPRPSRISAAHADAPRPSPPSAEEPDSLESSIPRPRSRVGKNKGSKQSSDDLLSRLSEMRADFGRQR